MANLKSNIALPSAKKMDQEAANWIAKIDKSGRIEAGNIGLDEFAKEDAKFAEWLNLSISHRVALLRLLSIWQRTDKIEAIEPDSIMEMETEFQRPFYGRKIFSMAAAASIIIAITLFNLDYLNDFSSDDTYQTVKGGQEYVPLIDGSKIELNSDTKIIADISKSERVIVLERGEAFFEVFRDENRPFKIIAGDQVVTVLGTKFAVHRKENGVEVAVTEGRVQIDNLKLPADTLSSTILTAGEIAKTEQGALLVMNQGLETVGRELSWRQGYLDFEETKLLDAAEEFNRYNHRELVIKDPEIANIRVSGKFKTDNLNAFVRLLTKGSGFRVAYTENTISVSK